ncbi:unnamed protein product [Ixodes pacificus]
MRRQKSLPKKRSLLMGKSQNSPCLWMEHCPWMSLCLWNSPQQMQTKRFLWNRHLVHSLIDLHRFEGVSLCAHM